MEWSGISELTSPWHRERTPTRCSARHECALACWLWTGACSVQSYDAPKVLASRPTAPEEGLLRRDTDTIFCPCLASRGPCRVQGCNERFHCRLQVTRLLPVRATFPGIEEPPGRACCTPAACARRCERAHGRKQYHVLLAPPVCLTPPSLILLLRIRKLKKDLLHELTESSTSGGMFCVCGTTRQVVVGRSPHSEDRWCSRVLA